MIFDSQDRIDLLNAQKEFQKLNNTNKYYKECINIIFNGLVKKIHAKNVIYFDFFVLDYEFDELLSLSSILPDFHKTHFDENIISSYELGFRFHNGGFIDSITRVLLDNKVTGLFITPVFKELNLLCKSIPDVACFYSNKIIENCDLSAFNDSSGGEMFFEIVDKSITSIKNSDKLIERLGSKKTLRNLWVQAYHYRAFEEYYIYHIRPRSNHNFYNGAIHLATLTPLPVNDFNLISSFLTDILSEVALQDAKEEEWKRVIDELSHSLKSDIGVLSNNNRNLERKIHTDSNIRNIVENNTVVLDYLEKKIELQVNMHRAGYNRENFDALSKSVKDSLMQDDVSLREVLLITLESILNSVNTLGLSSDLHKKNIVAAIIRTTSQVLKLKDFRVFVIKTGIQVVLYDLLKNAFYNTDANDPIVSISIKEYLNTIHLCIYNNGYMPKDVVNFIRHNVEGGTYSKRHKTGIRHSKRILAYKDFAIGGKWKIDVSISSKERSECELYIKIPRKSII